jgi:sporulation protein YunB
MTNAEKKKRKRLGRRLVAFGLAVLAFAFYFDIRVRPLIERISEYQSRVATVRIINDTILNELGSGNYNYDSLITIGYDTNGEIKSIESDMNTINRLKSRSALLINEAVGTLEKMNIGVSLGTASGVAFLYGRGPILPVRVLPKGYANSVLISDFSSAGINQTRHRIIMEIEVNLTAILPGYSKDLNVMTSFLVAETIIVGDIPHMYMQVISNDGQLFNRISEILY